MRITHLENKEIRISHPNFLFKKIFIYLYL